MGSVLLRIAFITQAEISTEAAAIQSRRTLELSETRAGIFDRNLSPLVNKSFERRILVFPDILDISALSGFFERDSLAEVFGKFEPSVMDIGGNIVEGEGIYNFSYPLRYEENVAAPHIIGYMNGGKGVSGIEMCFDEFLSENGSSVAVTYYADGTGRLLAVGRVAIGYREMNELVENGKVTRLK